MFIYTHTEIVPGVIAISAMSSSQYIIISGLIRDLHLTAEHHLQWHADMLMSRLLLYHALNQAVVVYAEDSTHPWGANIRIHADSCINAVNATREVTQSKIATNKRENPKY